MGRAAALMLGSALALGAPVAAQVAQLPDPPRAREALAPHTVAACARRAPLGSPDDPACGIEAEIAWDAERRVSVRFPNIVSLPAFGGPTKVSQEVGGRLRESLGDSGLDRLRQEEEAAAYVGLYAELIDRVGACLDSGRRVDSRRMACSTERSRRLSVILDSIRRHDLARPETDWEPALHFMRLMIPPLFAQEAGWHVGNDLLRRLGVEGFRCDASNACSLLLTSETALARAVAQSSAASN